MDLIPVAEVLKKSQNFPMVHCNKVFKNDGK